jgi:uncharacterized membrane protein HdeD (DUF308 family)
MDNEFTEFNSADTDSETEHQGWFSRIINSIVGVLVGLVMFFGSFVGIFINEGTTDFAAVMRKAPIVAPDQANPQANGKLASLTGPIAASPAIGDPNFVKPGSYALLNRTVEMYAWKEIKETQSQKKTGGSKTTTTTYRYGKVWTTQPADSAKFRKSGYDNPKKAIPNQLIKPTALKIGQYNLDRINLTTIANPIASCANGGNGSAKANNGGVMLPKQQLRLTPETIVPPATTAGSPRVVNENYFFLGRGTPDQPQVGDLRICYQPLPLATVVTAFGKVQGNQLAPAEYKSQRFFRLFTGDRRRAIADLKAEYKLWLWIFRFVGFLCMWMGLWLIFDPISTVLDFLPFLGDIAEGITGVTTLIAALVLSAVAMIISSLVQQPIVLGGAILVTALILLSGKAGLRSWRGA